MKCPYCAHKIYFFSKEMNKMGAKSCSKCGGAIKPYMEWKIAIPLIALSIFAIPITRNLLTETGLSTSITKPLGFAIVMFLLFILSMKIKKNETA